VSQGNPYDGASSQLGSDDWESMDGALLSIETIF
jgi:hypothetical protein